MGNQSLGPLVIRKKTLQTQSPLSLNSEYPMFNNSYDDKWTIVVTQAKRLEMKTKLPFM